VPIRADAALQAQRNARRLVRFPLDYIELTTAAPGPRRRITERAAFKCAAQPDEAVIKV